MTQFSTHVRVLKSQNEIIMVQNSMKSKAWGLYDVLLISPPFDES